MSQPSHMLKVVGRSARIAWSRSPMAGRRAQVQRSITVKLAEGNRALVRSLRMPLSPGGAAEVEFAAVLDGNTLNLRALVVTPGAGAGGVGGTVPGEGWSAHLLLASGHVRHTVPARLRATADGLAVEVCAPLGRAVDGVPLTAGRWSLSVQIVTPATPAGAALELPLLGPGRPHAAKGPAGSYARCPRTGVRYRTTLSPTGQLHLAVTAARPSAEVVRIRTGMASLTVDLRLQGGATGPARLEFRTEHGLIETACEPVPDAGADRNGEGPLLRAVVPLRQLFDRSSGETSFELRVVDAGGRRLSLRRAAHDLYHPGQVTAMSAVSGLDSAGRVWRCSPRYGRHMALNLRTWPARGVTIPTATSMGTTQ